MPDLIFAVFSLAAVYLWNKFIVKNLIHQVLRINGGFDKNNNNSGPMNFMVKNEKYIYYAFASFYWIVAIIGSIMILFW
jgi:hypothetical protein